jgi:hypothetical protein
MRAFPVHWSATASTPCTWERAAAAIPGPVWGPRVLFPAGFFNFIRTRQWGPAHGVPQAAVRD